MISYIGRHAELYDIFYHDKPYREESEFVHTCIQEFCNNEKNYLLELACGTGSHAIELSKYQYNIIGLDYSESMLRVAKKRVQDKSISKVEFILQDIREINVPKGPFDAVYCLFDSIGYVETNENVKKVFNGVKHNLKPGGLFIFEFWHAAAMIKYYDPLRVKRWKLDDREILRISETFLDVQKQTASVNYNIYELFSDGTYKFIQEVQHNRFFLIQEMQELVCSSGLMPIRWFAGFSRNELITPEVWHIVSVVKKN